MLVIKKLDSCINTFNKSVGVLLFRTVGCYSELLIIILEVSVDER